MSAANPVEDFARRSGASVRNIVQPLADVFFRVCAGGNVEQLLVGFGVLHDRNCLPSNSKHDRTLALVEMFHHFG